MRARADSTELDELRRSVQTGSPHLVQSNQSDSPIDRSKAHAPGIPQTATHRHSGRHRLHRRETRAATARFWLRGAMSRALFCETGRPRLKNPVVCREDRITRLVPQKLLNAREVIRAALSQVTARQVETNWSMAGPMPGDPDWSGGTVCRDSREVAINAPAAAVFRAICRLGGKRGWHGANWLWAIRGWLDRLAGGPACAAAAVIPRSSATSKRSISGASWASSRTVAFRYEPKCDYRAKRCSSSE